MTDQDNSALIERLMLNTPVITQDHMDAATEIMPRGADALAAAQARIEALEAEADPEALTISYMQGHRTGWNEAIEAAKQLAAEWYHNSGHGSPADEIETLKKGQPT